MTFILWYLSVGLLLIAMALSGSVLKRLPLSTSMLYLAAGFVLGPYHMGLIKLDAVADAGILERITEIAVLISLFSAGLKLRLPLSNDRWHLPIRLASASMIVTVGLIAALARFALDMSWGAGILLGAILAPTDPVLASDVQTQHPTDTDRLRFSLTGEAGLNDGSAFPFVMLGLGLLGTHDLGSGLWRWLAVDVLWAISGGLIVGTLLGMLTARFVVYLRHHHKEAVGLDDFFALGLIAISYGFALLIHSYGFLAVFAAGLALRGVERKEEESAPKMPPSDESPETNPHKAAAYMAEAVLGFTEQLERIAEVAVVLIVGAMLSSSTFSTASLSFILVLLLVIRPVSVLLGLIRSKTSPMQRALISWFGIRGIGSVYYLTFAISHGVPEELAHELAHFTLSVVTASIVVHGISVTPLMNIYQNRKKERKVR